MIHVCSLARLHDTVRETGARHVVTLIKDVSLVHRPATIKPENHLLLDRSEEHTSELQSPDHLVCRLLLEKKKNSHSEAGSVAKRALTTILKRPHTALDARITSFRSTRFSCGKVSRLTRRATPTSFFAQSP